MTINKLATSLFGLLALASTGLAGTAPASGGKACTSCTPAPAADDSLGASVNIGYDSSFIFRGLELANDWMTVGANIGVPLNSQFTLNLGAEYGNTVNDKPFNFLGLPISNDLERLVLNAALATKIGSTDVSLGYRHYSYNGDIGLMDTSEVSLGLGQKLGAVNFGVAANYDITNEGWYLEAGANTEIALTDSISLVPGASIGYVLDYGYQTGLPVNNSSFTAVHLSLGAPIKLSKTATLTPFVGYNIPVDDLDVLDETFHGGVTLTVKF
jgi:hypothetical protein